jgi:hypothetical protein
MEVVYLSGANPAKISKIRGRDVTEFTFKSTHPFVEYIVGVVQDEDSVFQGLSPILGHNGSQNIAGTGSWEADEEITVTINGRDLHAASPWDGHKILKVYVRAADGEWSV